MREENRTIRQRQIEDAAYDVLQEKGYSGASMLAVAKKARASNETLYNWYGDKRGLFRALVVRNAEKVKTYLETELQTDHDARSILSTLGPKLLGLLTSERAIALNRAAAADSSGELGATLAQSGREAVLPLLKRVMERAKREGLIVFRRSEEAVGLYLDLLVGDLQIRRAIGSVDVPTNQFCKKRSDAALTRLQKLLQDD